MYEKNFAQYVFSSSVPFLNISSILSVKSSSAKFASVETINSSYDGE
ncbi:unknown [Clostridium sp. CAG:813]|nr:unknown [Clostridium sp. CAG:813]